MRRTRRDIRSVHEAEDVVAPNVRISINVAPAKPLDVNVDVLMDAPRKEAFFQGWFR